MSILQSLEKAYVVVVLFFLTGAGVAGNVGEGGATGRAESQPWENIGRLIVCVTLVPLFVIHWKRVLGGVRQSSWLIALCSVAIASTVWSYDPRFTLRHCIFLLIVTLFGIYIATCFNWDEQINLFGWLLMFVVLSSACVAIFIPSYGLSHDAHWGAVKGIYPQKNTMSAMMVFAILTFVLAKPKAMPNWLRNSTLMGAGILLILSGSATSLVALMFCIALYPVLYLLRFSKRNTLPLWVPLVPIFAMGASLLIANFDLVAEAVGRNSTLTSRIPMWTEVLNAISRRPWFGYGYDVFWSEWSSDLAKVIYVLNNWRPPHAHNGYLDILLSLGVVGLLIFAGGLVTNVWRAGRMFRANEIHGAKWPLFFLLFFAVLNLGESCILRIMSFFWIPFVAIYVSLALQEVEERQLAGARHAVRADDIADANGIVPEFQT
jgi:exopolysaccharide production protein ExoQ